MKPKRLFSVMQEMECLAGDTIGPFVVSVQNDGKPADISGLTMRLIVACSDAPAEAVHEKECTVTDGKFKVMLTSADTAKWNGEYQLHFALYDAAGLVYRKLAGKLWVSPVPKGSAV